MDICTPSGLVLCVGIDAQSFKFISVGALKIKADVVASYLPFMTRLG